MTRAIRGLVLLLILVPSALSAQEKMMDYERWQAACAKLVSNRDLKGKEPDKKTLPLRSYAEFDQVLEAFLKEERRGPLSQAKTWVGRAPNPKVFFDATRSWNDDPDVLFQPFAQKLVLPNDAVVILMGDLHGDIRSLLNTLDELHRRKILTGFKLRDTKHHLIFLGDYCDRGAYGVEVLYTLLRLKLANPQQVHLARGNHEDFSIIARFGFLGELRYKFGADGNLRKLLRVYDLLPVVIYVGNKEDFLQMNHGGMEPGYDPRDLLAAAGDGRCQLLGKLRQKTYHQAHPGRISIPPCRTRSCAGWSLCMESFATGRTRIPPPTPRTPPR